MINFLKILLAAVIGGAVVLFGSMLLHSPSGVGASVAANVTTIGNPWVFTGTVKTGASGTARSNQVITTCSMIADNAAVGTTSAYAYCLGVTGVTSSDLILASFATSTTNANDRWIIAGAKASTTAGAIDFSLLKQTGVAASQAPSAVTSIGSTTVIEATH